WWVPTWLKWPPPTIRRTRRRWWPPRCCGRCFWVSSRLEWEQLRKRGEVSMVPVRVCVLSSMFDGRDVENIRQEMEGRFAEKRGEWVLRYVEQSGEEAATRTTLRGREDCITVVRSGGLNFRHTYFPGKTTTSWVHTPAGSMEMEVTTRDYRRHRWEGGGEC